VATTSRFAALVKHIVNDDWENYDRLTQELDEKGAWGGWAEYLGAAFFLAVDKRFAPSDDRSEIIRFVADARAEFTASGSDIDPAAAETMVRSVLSQADAPALDSATVVSVELVLVRKLLIDAALDGEQLDAFLADVEQIADRWVGQGGGDQL
jgi:hypothetical protein